MDEENFNVNDQDVVVNEEAEKETSSIDDFLSDLDYENSEYDAQIALLRLEIYNVHYKPVYDKYVSKIKDVINSFEDERARTIPVYQKELTLEDREEAERIKAMPEYQELQQSCELYMNLSDEVQSGEIKKMTELLEKIPENLRYLYFEQLHDFEQGCDKEVKIQKNIIKSVFLFLIYWAGLFVFSYYWDSLNWSWWGKGISFIAIMFIFHKLSRMNMNSKIQLDMKHIQKDEIYFGILFLMAILSGIMYLCVAFVSFMLPSWGSFSWRGWKTPIVLAVVIALICVIVLSFIFYVFHKIAKRAAVYMKDFEDFTSQYNEYRKFKKSAEGAKK